MNSLFGEGSFVGHKTEEIIVVALDGTGDTDDIQEALTMVSSGGEVYIKEGIYEIKATLTFTGDNVLIRGQGKKTRIQQGATELGNDGLLSIVGDYNVIKHIGFYSGANTDYSIKLNGYQNLITNCFVNIALDTIEVTGWFNRIQNNFIADGVDGIALINADGTLITGNHIINHFRGIQIDADSAHNTIIANVFNANTTNVSDNGSNTLPNGAEGTNNLEIDDLNTIV